MKRVVLWLACAAVIGMALFFRAPTGAQPAQQPGLPIGENPAHSTCAYVQSHLPELATQGQYAACVDQTPHYGVSPAEVQYPPVPDPPPLPVRTSSP